MTINSYRPVGLSNSTTDLLSELLEQIELR